MSIIPLRRRLTLATLGGLVACAPKSTPPSATSSEAQLRFVLGSGCRDSADLPQWTARDDSGATISGVDLRLTIPEGWKTIDSVGSNVATYRKASSSGFPDAVLELQLTPICETYDGPGSEKRLAHLSMADISGTARLERGRAGLGDGLFTYPTMYVGEQAWPLWFRHVTVLRSDSWTLIIAAACGSTEPHHGTCEPDVAAVVDGARARAGL